MALCVAFAAGAQTGLVEFPYNPDADNDDIIGVNDLLELLSLFGGEFAEESLYLNDSNTAAVYHIEGSWKYGLCEAKCRDLPSGKWRMIDYETWAEFYLEVEQMCIAGTNTAWLRETPVQPPANSSSNLPSIYGDYDDKGRLTFFPNTTNCTCVCETHERPKVEYSYCEGGDIQSCAEVKVADGWYPLSGITSNPSFNGSSDHSTQKVYQAFWRWAE